MVSDIAKFKIYTLDKLFIKETDILPTKFTGFANYYDKTYIFYKDGLVHREDGPAVEDSNGVKEWFLNGKLHRIGGAAAKNHQGIPVYWIFGKKITKEQHDLLYSIMKLKKLI